MWFCYSVCVCAIARSKPPSLPGHPCVTILPAETLVGGDMFGFGVVYNRKQTVLLWTETARVMMLQRTTSCLNHRWPQFVIKMGSGTRVWSFLNHSADHATVAWNHAWPAPAHGTVCSPCHMYVFLFGSATVCSISWNKATSLTGHLHFPVCGRNPPCKRYVGMLFVRPLIHKHVEVLEAEGRWWCFRAPCPDLSRAGFNL